MLVVLLLTGCGATKEKTQKKDYSEYLFSDVVWTRDGGNDIETLKFKNKYYYRLFKGPLTFIFLLILRALAETIEAFPKLFLRYIRVHAVTWIRRPGWVAVRPI